MIVSDGLVNERPSLAPVVVTAVTFPLVLLANRFLLPPRLGSPGVLGHQLVAEFGLLVVTVGIVAWARWWRQTGLAGPWRQRWWALVPAGLLVVQWLFGLGGVLARGDPTRLPLVPPLAGMVGFCEETLTRGVMLYGLSRFGALAAGLVTSAYFGLLHATGFFGGLPGSFLVVQMISAALLGMLFAGLRLRMLSIWPMIVAHAAFDVPALLEGYPLHVQPVGLFGALFSIGLMLPFGMTGLGLLLWDQLNGTKLWAAAARAAGA